jgi:hypothetical protein
MSSTKYKVRETVRSLVHRGDRFLTKAAAWFNKEGESPYLFYLRTEEEWRKGQETLKQIDGNANKGSREDDHQLAGKELQTAARPERQFC